MKAEKWSGPLNIGILHHQLGLGYHSRDAIQFYQRPCIFVPACEHIIYGAKSDPTCEHYCAMVHVDRSPWERNWPRAAIVSRPVNKQGRTEYSLESYSQGNPVDGPDIDKGACPTQLECPGSCAPGLRPDRSMYIMAANTTDTYRERSSRGLR